MFRPASPKPSLGAPSIRIPEGMYQKGEVNEYKMAGKLSVIKQDLEYMFLSICIRRNTPIMEAPERV